LATKGKGIPLRRERRVEPAVGRAAETAHSWKPIEPLGDEDLEALLGDHDQLVEAWREVRSGLCARRPRALAALRQRLI